MPMIDQSVPRPASATDPSKMDPAMLDYLTGNDEQEAIRQQQMVQQLRDYGGGAMPQMRGKYAPQGMEYAATLGNRLASMGGQQAGGAAEAAALEQLRRRLYPAAGAAAAGGLPADPSFAGVGAAPY